MIARRWLRAEIATLALLAAPVGVAWGEAPGLQRAIAALKSGNAPQALTLLTTELATPDRSPEDRARAFYYRAKAYYATKQPALAIADAGAALWLNKLPASEAADAAQLKARAQSSVSADTGLPAFKMVTNSSPPPDPASAKTTAAAAVPRPLPTPPAEQIPPASRQAAVVAPPAEHQAAPAWSSAAVTREELPQPPASAISPEPAKSAAAWITTPPRPAPVPQATSEIETGSITRTDASSASQTRQVPVPVPVPQDPSVAVQAPRPTSLPQVAAPSASQTEPGSNTPAASIPSLLGLGALFEPQADALPAEVEQANEFQRRYREKIRRHNDELQARLAAPNATATDTGATADR